MNNLLPFNPEILEEDVDLEAKRATGKHGRGEFPNEFLPTYSAMANTEGGVILLGVEEFDEKLRPAGIQEPERVIKTLWDALNNPQRVNKNILTENSVTAVDWDGKTIIRVVIPRARRENRPVYIGSNPLRGTYRRNFQGDYLCDEETVKRMLADQIDVSRDSKALEGFDFRDLDMQSFKAYRQQFSASKPGHPWLAQDDLEFLKSIGGWAKDRATGKESLTLAGLLMFGQNQKIREAVPNYFVDYQERPEPKTEPRWIDRLVPDGTWSGNLYDFVRKVIVKLYADLKIPFMLKDGVRVDQTPVHEALREALINTLIHADFAGSVPILVVKRPDLFGFRNPGTMRVATEEAIRGGVSDSRNRNLQQMFRYIGFGEQAGSGIPKIYSAWKEQSWRLPILKEKTDPPDYTLLELRMVSLLPREVVEDLERRFGGRFRRLPELQRLALVTVAVEGEVTHARLKSMVSDHPSDISKQLAALVREKFVTTHGSGRAMRYFFADQPPEGVAPLQVESFHGEGSQHLNANSQHLPESSQHLLAAPDVKEGSALWVQAQKLGASTKEKGKVPAEEMRASILAIGELGFITLRDLAKLLGRDAMSLQNHYLNSLLKNGNLELKYPDKRQHPQQAYRVARPKV